MLILVSIVIINAGGFLGGSGISWDGNSTISAAGFMKIITSNGPITIIPGKGFNLDIILNGLGDFTINEKDLFVDTSESKIGIGTNAPNDKLTVNGSIRLMPQSSSICSEEHKGAIYYDEEDDMIYVCKNDGWSEYRGPQGLPGTSLFEIEKYNCNDFQSYKKKKCNIGQHFFCYLTGYENRGLSNCLVNGELRGNWSIEAKNSKCNVTCMNEN